MKPFVSIGQSYDIFSVLFWYGFIGLVQERNPSSKFVFK
jgi:hypothetical protein